MSHLEWTRDEEFEFTGLIYAEKVEEVKKFMEGRVVPTYYSQHKKKSFLNDAIAVKNLEIIKLLLDAGVSANSAHKYKKQDSNSCLATAMSKNLEIAKLLLSYGCDPNNPMDRSVIGALNGRSKEHQIAALNLLIEYGIDLNQEFEYFSTGEFFTALDHSGYPDFGHPEVHELLLKHGAKTSKQLGRE